VAAPADAHARREATTIGQITKTLNHGGYKAAGCPLHPQPVGKHSIKLLRARQP
jgi:hypothetical protein